MSVHLLYSHPPSLFPSFLSPLSPPSLLPRLTSQILIELLKTYSSKDAHKSVELAQRLIVLVISDPNQFLFDHVLSLEPVAALSSQNIYQVSAVTSKNLSSLVYYCLWDGHLLETHSLTHTSRSACGRHCSELFLLSCVESRDCSVVYFNHIMACKELNC